MIIQCEECLTKYNLNESLLKPEGSQVRCSLCKHVFTAYPPQEPPSDSSLGDEFEETVALDSPPVLKGEGLDKDPEEKEFDFDKLFGEAEEAPQEKGPLYEESGFSAPQADETLNEHPPVEPHSSAFISETLADRLKERSQKHAETMSGKKKGGRSSWALTFLVIIVLLAGGIGAVVFWAPQYLPDSLRMLRPPAAQTSDPGVRRLSFKGVTGSFVESRSAGQLFVIKGTVTNEYPKGRSFILVKGSILDDKGQVIKQKEAYAGNTFTEEEIKEKTLTEINESLKVRTGNAQKNVDIGPGAAIPFMIVFENLPENLSEFTIEAVSSSPTA